MAYNNGYRYVAFDAANREYQEFKTIEEAETWIKENDCECIPLEVSYEENYIAEIQYKSVVDITGERSNYHVHTEECPDDCDKEKWPYGDDCEWVGRHHFEKINWEE